MSYASISGRAKTNPKSPQAHAICDRCGFRYNHIDLAWQFDWAGASLINKRILVCNTCMDDPQQQLRAIVVPADPVPIINPRVESFADDETDYETTSALAVINYPTGIPVPSTTVITDQNGQPITNQPIGPPNGLEAGAIMPLQENVKYDIQLPIVSVFSTGTDRVSVTCSSAHNLVTNSQISVQGLSNKLACGFYSVTVTTATAFTYQTYSAIPAGSLLTGQTSVLTAIVGLPYNYTQIPLVGP